jgi:antirestriction protein ArdC
MSMTVKWYGAKAKAAERKAAARGLMLGAEHVLEMSKRVVPIEESTLLNSGVTSVDAGALRAAVSYDTVYACRQHEELTWRHDAGRTAKYLENPLNSERRAVNELVAREIKAAL